MLTRPTRSAARAANGRPSEAPPRDSELLILREEGREGLVGAARALADRLRRDPGADLAALARASRAELRPGGSRLALVAADAAEAARSLDRAAQRLDDPRCTEIKGTSGLYYADEPLYPGGSIAFLFPGEGAQYLGMLGDVRDAFPEVDAFFAQCDAKTATAGDGTRPLTGLFLPPAGLGAEALAEAEERLRRIDHAMISVMMADWALNLLLGRFGIVPDVVAGHSMGELVALWAAGCVDGDDEAVLPLVHETMRAMQREEESAGAEFILLAVGAGREALDGLIAALGEPSVEVAMDNCPRQAVLVGPPGPMANVEEELRRRRILFERLPFRRPYHTARFEPMIRPVRELFRHFDFRPPRLPVYSCTTGRPFPSDPEGIRELAVAHWAEPVRFTDLIRNLHDDGVRLFVEPGPRGNLSAFVEDILRGRPFLAMPSDVPRRSGLTQLNHLLAAMVAHHVPVDLGPLGEGRDRRPSEEPPADHPPRAAARIDAGAASVPGVAVGGATATPPGPGPTSPPPSAPDLRAQVMERHLRVMERFLEDQEAVTRLFLSRPRSPRPAPAPSAPVGPAQDPASDLSSPPPPPPPVGAAEPGGVRPLLGEFVAHEPGRSLVMRRVLDLREDRFAAHHTVGGQQISKVDPDHHGVPVMPMTFTLEMMAEAGSVLVPGKVVTSVREVKLYRWLAFDEEAPTVVELTARVLPDEAPGGPRRVSVEVRDLGRVDRPKEKTWLAAQGTVVLDDAYPPSPPPLGFQLTNERPANLSVERTYHNLFHGPLFQGVRANVRTGDEGIESRIEVLPRGGLFRSVPEPEFLIDPVLFDVVMHPLAAWHLVQPDQAGRIMLPIGVESLEVFGPPPAPGTTLTARSWVTKSDARSFLHQGEAMTAGGAVVLRLNGVRCWRFYVPFGEVNFHGPKDQYFLSHRWRRAEEPRAALGAADVPLALVRLEPPVDLNQGSMLQVTAKVTLTPEELRRYRALEARGEEVKGWLFDRNAAKDAVRLAWYERTGERLFPSDIEAEPAADGRVASRGRAGGPSYPAAAVARSGSATVAIAAAGAGAVGIALARMGSSEDEQGLPPLGEADRAFVGALGVDPAEAALRLRCALRAAAQAAGLLADRGGAGVARVAEVDPATGVVAVGVPAGPSEPASRRLRVATVRDEALIVAWTLGEGGHHDRG